MYNKEINKTINQINKIKRSLFNKKYDLFYLLNINSKDLFDLDNKYDLYDKHLFLDIENTFPDNKLIYSNNLYKLYLINGTVNIKLLSE